MRAEPDAAELARWRRWCEDLARAPAAGRDAAAAWLDTLGHWEQSAGEHARLIRRLCQEGRVYVELAARKPTVQDAMLEQKAFVAGIAFGHSAALGLAGFEAVTKALCARAAARTHDRKRPADAEVTARASAKLAGALAAYSASLNSVAACTRADDPEDNADDPHATYVKQMREFERAYLATVETEAYARVHGELINALVDILAAGHAGIVPGLAQSSHTLRRSSEDDDGAVSAPEERAQPSGVAVTGRSPIADVSRQVAAGAATIAGLGSVETGPTPRLQVASEDGFALYRYEPLVAGSESTRPPILVVYALANKPYVVDLEPKRSFVHALLGEGLDVYLMEWQTPTIESVATTLEDYVLRYVDSAVDVICARRGADRVALLGICQGGVLSLAYSALRPHKVAALVTMVTPVNFHAPGNLLSAWMRHVDVDALVNVLGNVPGELLNWAFDTLRPLRSSGLRFVKLLEQLHDAEAAANWMRMERWIADSPDQAGEAFRQFARDLFQRNALVTGGLRIGTEDVSLASVRAPVLNLHAAKDHIVPPASAQRTDRWLGTCDYEEAVIPTGHIGVFTSQHARTAAAQRIGAWLSARAVLAP